MGKLTYTLAAERVPLIFDSGVFESRRIRPTERAMDEADYFSDS